MTGKIEKVSYEIRMIVSDVTKYQLQVLGNTCVVVRYEQNHE